ncbi:hypothetical protein E5676_scaffold1193G00230 [Cucumis melo var. makuwa]|uniref:Mitochondrial protein n=1 Tax=Cucumis melo var. makuwa TaxID=1194695 RepID=A0A5A7UWQ8_CUCMM|nr:hypothetical protein E6C27_scaffold518G00340 [Cucumis melo var. makuwa]TYK14107.1 hypothetical protein E5676_scaffold1193G00230 [Cucumis melo var. makuwa]
MGRAYMSDSASLSQLPGDPSSTTLGAIAQPGAIVDKISTLGYCTFVWGNFVTWRSKKQGVVARSNVEAEYWAMSLGICEEIWL